MSNTYDFYKPRLDSEYPEVDGPVSVTTYISALDEAYSRFREKIAKAKKLHINGHAGSMNGNSNAKFGFSLEDIDYAVFHSPYGKQVQKALGRLYYNDFISCPSAPQFSTIPEDFRNIRYAASLTDKTLERAFITASKAVFSQKVEPSMHCSKRLGNMYTASLYGCLASLLSAVEPCELLNKRISMFAFGSGCAASFFTLRIKGDTSEIRTNLNLLERLHNTKVVPCQEYVDALSVCPAWFRDLIVKLTFCSFVRRTTMLPIIPLKALLRTSGLVLTILNLSITSSAGNMHGHQKLNLYSSFPESNSAHLGNSVCLHSAHLCTDIDRIPYHNTSFYYCSHFCNRVLRQHETNTRKLIDIIPSIPGSKID